jgi:hypothetical protein
MKLQPNYSWQKYEGKPEDQKNQFQYQLQNQHVQVSNSVNATIDDLSYWTRERQTGFTWIDERPIWTKTFTGTLAGTTNNTIPHGIEGLRKVIKLEGSAQTAEPIVAGNTAITLPYVDGGTPLNSVSVRAGLVNIFIETYNATWNGLLFSITIYYTKT